MLSPVHELLSNDNADFSITIICIVLILGNKHFVSFFNFMLQKINLLFETY